MKTFFFDLDGVLTDSRPGLYASFRAALKAIGLPYLSDCELDEFLGTPLPEMFRSFKRDISLLEIETGIKAFRAEYENSGVKQNCLYPGVLAMLKFLTDHNYSAWIVTSKPEFYAKQVAKFLGIDGYMKGIVGAGLDEQDTKTSLIANALSRAAVASNEVIMLGDRHYDITGALANKVLPVGALWGYGSRSELYSAGCRRFAQTPKEFQALFVENSNENPGSGLACQQFASV